MTITLYTSGRVMHEVYSLSDTRTLCNRPTTGLHPLPADPWSRIGAEVSTTGHCLRCERAA